MKTIQLRFGETHTEDGACCEISETVLMHWTGDFIRRYDSVS